MNTLLTKDRAGLSAVTPPQPVPAPPNPARRVILGLRICLVGLLGLFFAFTYLCVRWGAWDALAGIYQRYDYLYRELVQ